MLRIIHSNAGPAFFLKVHSSSQKSAHLSGKVTVLESLKSAKFETVSVYTVSYHLPRALLNPIINKHPSSILHLTHRINQFKNGAFLKLKLSIRVIS